MRNFGTLEKFLIFFGVFIFLFLTIVVVFKREWLDNVFSGPIYVFFYDDPYLDSDIATMPSVFINVLPTGVNEKKGSVFLSLESTSNITGVELFFEKDPSLEITDFTCNPPFECLFFDVKDSEVSFVAFLPLNETEPFEMGDHLLGEFEYTGSGKLYFNSDSGSFISDVQNPEFNVLDLTYREFLF